MKFGKTTEANTHKSQFSISFMNWKKLRSPAKNPTFESFCELERHWKNSLRGHYLWSLQKKSKNSDSPPLSTTIHKYYVSTLDVLNLHQSPPPRYYFLLVMYNKTDRKVSTRYPSPLSRMATVTPVSPL